MFTFRNKYLDEITAEFNVKDIKLLNETQIRALCEKLSIPTVQKFDRERVVGIDLLRTIESIRYATSIPALYLPEPYWEPHHREIAERYNVKNEILSHSTGPQTFELMAELGLGWNDFRAGETRTLDVPLRWILDELTPGPLLKVLEITDENGNPVGPGYKASDYKTPDPVEPQAEPVVPAPQVAAPATTPEPVQTPVQPTESILNQASKAPAEPHIVDTTLPQKPLPATILVNGQEVPPMEIDRDVLIEEIYNKTGKKYSNKSHTELVKIYAKLA
jgi:hypothetical protein